MMLKRCLAIVLTMALLLSVICFAEETGNNAMDAIFMEVDSQNAIVIFAGTEGFEDVLQDSLIAIDAGIFGWTSARVFDVIKTLNPIEWFHENQPEAANRLIKELVGAGYQNIYVAGHSLGGHLAVDVTLNNSSVKECYAFDPPGRGDAWYRQYVSASQASNITSYLCEGSYVSAIGKHVGKTLPLNVEPNKAGPLPNHGIDQIIDALGGLNEIQSINPSNDRYS